MVEEYVRKPLGLEDNCLEVAIKHVFAEAADLMEEATEQFYELSEEYYTSFYGEMSLDHCIIAVCKKLLSISRWLMAVEENLKGAFVELPLCALAEPRLAEVFGIERDHLIPDDLRYLVTRTDRLSRRVENLHFLFLEYVSIHSQSPLTQHFVALCPMLKKFVYKPAVLAGI